ncbi:MAG: nucleoside triphosphate pyrophosphohydrolase [Pseudomonadota bacterium]
MSEPLDRTRSDQLVRDETLGLPRLLEIMRRLRDPKDGCPWDVKQTYASIAPYTIEEAYEVADAIEREDLGDLRDELGDLLLQVVYHAQIAAEAGAFDFDDVARAVSDKMFGRHPHVFGDAEHADWDAIKAAEKAAKGVTRESVLEDVPSALPALTRSDKLQRRAARVGFDWPETESVIEKIAEETRELTEAAQSGEADAIEDEFGDVLFGLVNLARRLKVDPETALRRTNAKFERRFRFIERALAEQGRTPEDATLEEMDALWNTAKRAERNAP